MNANEVTKLHQGGKLVQHEVPQGLGKLFSWAFDPVKKGPLKTIFGGLVRGGFKLLQLPLVRNISPFMKYNLLFGAGMALVGSAYKVLTGRVGEGIHGLAGNAIALGTSTAAAFAIPKMLGLSLVGGPAAWIGFGITMLIEPKIRKLVGLDKEKPQGAAAAGLEAGSPMGQLGNALTGQMPFLANANVGAAQNPYAAYAYASNPYAAYSGAYNPWGQYGGQATNPIYAQQAQLQAELAKEQVKAEIQLAKEASDDRNAQKLLNAIQKDMQLEQRRNT